MNKMAIIHGQKNVEGTVRLKKNEQLNLWLDWL